MYENPCNHCENLERCMPMMNMHMANMPMTNMPMMTMPMANMPMMTMPIFEDNDEDLKKLYPKSYRRIYPIVKRHCDMLVARYGTMYCPTKDEMDEITEEIYDKCEDYYRDDYGSEDFNDGAEDFNDDVDNVNDVDDMRQRRRRRRRRTRRPGASDLIKILILRDLIGRRYYYGY